MLAAARMDQKACYLIGHSRMENQIAYAYKQVTMRAASPSRRKQRSAGCPAREFPKRMVQQVHWGSDPAAIYRNERRSVALMAFAACAAPRVSPHWLLMIRS